MSYPKLKIADREILALVPRQKPAFAQRSVLPNMEQLMQAARAHTDAVAFAFVGGRWHAAA